MACLDTFNILCRWLMGGSVRHDRVMSHLHTCTVLHIWLGEASGMAG